MVMMVGLGYSRGIIAVVSPGSRPGDDGVDG